MNIFLRYAQICKTSNLNVEATIYTNMAEALDKIGKDAMLNAIQAHINKCYECEAWNKLFMLDAYTLLLNN